MKLTIPFSEYEPWSGAVPHWERIYNANKVGELETILDELYPDGMTEGELNDLLWFDNEQVFEWLGMPAEEEDEPEEEEELIHCQHPADPCHNKSELERLAEQWDY